MKPPVYADQFSIAGQKPRAASQHRAHQANASSFLFYGDTEELNTLINSADMNAKKVQIAGKYYVSTNAILVSSIKVVE